MAKKKYYSSFGMDRTSHANMPTEVVMKDYASVDGVRTGELDDTIEGVDYQMRADAKGGKKGKHPEKY